MVKGEESPLGGTWLPPTLSPRGASFFSFPPLKPQKLSVSLKMCPPMRAEHIPVSPATPRLILDFYFKSACFSVARKFSGFFRCNARFNQITRRKRPFWRDNNRKSLFTTSISARTSVTKLN